MFQYIKQVSSLEKIFADCDGNVKENNSLSALCGEEISYQIIFKTSDKLISPSKIHLSVTSDISDCVSMYNVVSVPSALPAYPDRSDDDYISKTPGLFPDLLMPLENNAVFASENTAVSVWVSVRLPQNAKSGKHKIEIKLSETLSGMSGSVSFEVDVINAVLPEQTLPVTLWFHNDCIADAHNVPVFSEKHWALIEQYMNAANEIGMNMILTPIFTPPLDTEIGGERPTVQLVDVIKEENYIFSFEKFDRYVALAQKCGMKYFEISHLFTQWGATHAPKIVANLDGEEKRIFGWDTDVRQPQYGEFLDEFLPQFTKHITELGIGDKCYFHVSDEPNDTMLDDYKFAKSLVAKHLEGFKMMDALSHYEFYKDGAVQLPVVATDFIRPFLDAKAEIFCYYCCGQCDKGVSNRFFAMPSARNRILACQMFKYDIKGFLQWGFNFYYSHHSISKINPFVTTDSLLAFPSGDAFIVYPSQSGKPYMSIRGKVFAQMLYDYRAMKLLESLSDKSTVMNIIEEKGSVEFDNHTNEPDFILDSREKINNAISRLAMCQK